MAHYVDRPTDGIGHIAECDGRSHLRTFAEMKSAIVVAVPIMSAVRSIALVPPRFAPVRTHSPIRHFERLEADAQSHARCRS